MLTRESTVDDLSQQFPNLPERINGLGELAYNLWWSWHPAALMLFKRLHRMAWKDSHNPVKFLKSLPREVLAAAAGCPGISAALRRGAG